MASQWQPSADSLSQLASCLKDSLSGFNKAAQKQAELMLTQAKSSPDINNYLVYLFSSTTPPDGVQCTPEDFHLVRAAAAIMLKNNIKTGWKQIPEASFAMIKTGIPFCLEDKNSQIRNYAGNIATEVVRRGGILSWPELLPKLLELLGNETGQVSPEAQEGAVMAMAKICEDNTKMLERELNGQRPLNFILPKLVQATKSPLPKVRAQALTAINVYTPRKSQAMLNVIDDLLQHIFTLATDSNPDVRRQVCRAFVQLVETRPDKLQPHLAGLVDYIITQQKSDDEELACDAAEFWLAVGEHEHLWQSLTPYISKIIPVLLECMVYSPEDIALLGGASDDEDEEDREEDIKPQFAKKSTARTANGGEGSADASQNGNAYEKLASMEDELEEGELEDFDDGDDTNPDERWTLRKCSAAALDVFARDYRDPVFECILPYLTTNLKHEDWPYREAAVLALGAVAEGCIDVVTPHLPELVPYLITLLNDPEPVVRQITCWTLGRYSSWAAQLSNPAQKQAFFEPMMEGILMKMLDKNKKVQEAGASAFANLEEKAGKNLEPYSGPIIQQFVSCFAKYKDRNMYILYDCVQTLAEHIGPVLARPDLVNQLMPALIDRWQKVSDQSRELFPLLECLSYVAMALNDAFTPFAQPIFSRCVNIIHQNLEASMALANNPALDVPDKDFLVTSLDLLSAIIQALDKEKSAQLVRESQLPFFELLTFCMEDPADEVRQSAYALLGDCAKYIFKELQSSLSNVFPVLLKQLDLDSILDEEIDSGFSVVNNACWSIGEIAVQYGDGMAPYVPELFQRFIETITNPGIPKGVTENAAIALGRLGLGNASLLAPHLASFAEEFLTSMDEVDPSDEKATAFRGFTVIVEQNPMAMEKSLLHFFTSIARYKDLKLKSDTKNGLHDDFQKAIGMYRQLIPQFNDFVNQMAPQDQQALRTNYAL
ncbi:armadillo-type protein [Pseudomassariella vexata]|uniref:Armadillo-type protein n=1 Tax=Pseudomassariella vexata TaxID=1141098 RepID=A0A1Y2EK45_9PEZI|nr:armadillo-type protein [Pseudomassariella vexata]ORY71887.1 armadillo-type protein [Pseudomassariella vexata]